MACPRLLRRPRRVPARLPIALDGGSRRAPGERALDRAGVGVRSASPSRHRGGPVHGAGCCDGRTLLGGAGAASFAAFFGTAVAAAFLVAGFLGAPAFFAVVLGTFLALGFPTAGPRGRPAAFREPEAFVAEPLAAGIGSVVLCSAPRSGVGASRIRRSTSRRRSSALPKPQVCSCLETSSPTSATRSC